MNNRIIITISIILILIIISILLLFYTDPVPLGGLTDPKEYCKKVAKKSCESAGEIIEEWDTLVASWVGDTTMTCEKILECNSCESCFEKYNL